MLYAVRLGECLPTFRMVVSHSSSRSCDVIALGGKGDTLRTMRHIPQHSARGKFWEVAYSLWNDLHISCVCACVCVRTRISIDLKIKC
jgi:hypothetical protein